MHFLFDLATAGISAFVWHWGLGIGAIIICVALAYFSAAIPILSHFRTDFLWVAAIIAVFLFAEGLGARDEAKRCEARTVVIEKHVRDVVNGAETPESQMIPDPFDDSK